MEKGSAIYAPLPLHSTVPSFRLPSQSPYGICLAANFASKVHEQVEEITNNVRLWCRANCHCNSKTSLCRPQRLSLSNREREKERGECSSRLDRITFTFFPTVSSSSFIANATPDVKIISLLYLNQFWFPPDLLAYLNNSRKPKKGNAKATR